MNVGALHTPPDVDTSPDDDDVELVTEGGNG